MTSRTSLFNRGIYKATVRRYIWGAVFYAIVLFMICAIPILFSINPDTYRHTMAENGAFILDDIYLFGPLVISFVVPTVVALLVYRFVHSKKNSIFVHSLPVSRRANYISTVLGGLTLMIAPIVLNGAVLTIMSLSAYGEFFDVTSCLIWTGLNVLSIVLMFSTASLAAFLTGNSFAMIGINALMHSIALIFMGSISSIASVFLYGYYETNALITKATEWNFIAYVSGLANRIAYTSDMEFAFDWVKFIIMLFAAGASYFAAYLLYKKRRLETAEDVAAYKCLNPIYKYLLTAIGSLGAFALYGYTLEDNSYLAVIITLVVSAVLYFASEMLLKKSLRIWKAYKGYLVFLVAFTAFISVFAFTGFFGFETRVPDPDKVESVFVCDSRALLNDNTYVENREIINYALSVHQELVQDEYIYTIGTYDENRRENLYLSYKLSNGSTVWRRYSVSEEMMCRVLDELYKSHEYKEKTMEIFSEDIGKIYNARIYRSGEEFIDEAGIEEFVECLKEDLLELEYTEIRNHSSWYVNIGLEYTRAEAGEVDRDRVYSINQHINANFKRSVKWLSDHGYADEIFDEKNCDLTCITADEWEALTRDKEKIALEAASGKMVDTVTVSSYERPEISNFPNAPRISNAEEKAKIRDYVLITPVRYVPGKEYSYYVLRIDEEGYLSTIAAFYDADILYLIG